MLAAWFREKYPEVVVGAVASSAPVEATIDFKCIYTILCQSVLYYNESAVWRTCSVYELKIILMTFDGSDPFGVAQNACSRKSQPRKSQPQKLRQKLFKLSQYFFIFTILSRSKPNPVHNLPLHHFVTSFQEAVRSLLLCLLRSGFSKKHSPKCDSQ